MTVIARSDLHVHWSALYNFVNSRVGDAELAADIAQEAYARLASLPANTVLLNSRAYLFTTAANLVTDHMRTLAVRGEAVDSQTLAETLFDPEPSAERGALSREALAVIRETIDGMPPRMREVFVLQRMEQLSYIEIAERLGMARNTVMVHMTRAMARCRDAMRAYTASSEQ